MARLMIDDDHGVAFEEPQYGAPTTVTMRDMMEGREASKASSRRHIIERMKDDGITCHSLLNMAYAANYNNLLLYDTFSVYASDLLDQWRIMRSGGESMVPRLDEHRHRRMTDAMVKMERCLKQFRQFRVAYFSHKGNQDLFNAVSDLYYEAVFRDVQMVELNTKQQLDKMGFPNSLLLARLETMRMISCLGVGLSWSIEDMTAVGYGDGRVSHVDPRTNMTGVQHWLCEVCALFAVPEVEASENVQRSFELFCNRVETGSLAIECFVIIGDERQWTDMPKWYIVAERPSEEERARFKYKTREEIEK